MNRLRTALMALVLVAAALVHAQARTAGPDTVVVRSGELELRALLWRPEGRGPFPAVLFNHGSGHAAGVDASGRPDSRHPDRLGPVFAKHGYVSLYLFRRGDGLSRGQGVPSADRMDVAFQAGGEEARNRVQMELLETDELGDVRSGFAYLRAIPDVDSRRIAVVGHSLGGSLALLLAEREKTVRAAVLFSAAGYSFDRSPELRARLTKAASGMMAATLFLNAANDYSLTAAKALSTELARLGKPSVSKVYPSVGGTAHEGHNFVDSAIPSWEKDVFTFLDAHTK